MYSTSWGVHITILPQRLDSLDCKGRYVHIFMIYILLLKNNRVFHILNHDLVSCMAISRRCAGEGTGPQNNENTRGVQTVHNQTQRVKTWTENTDLSRWSYFSVSYQRPLSLHSTPLGAIDMCHICPKSLANKIKYSKQPPPPCSRNHKENLHFCSALHSIRFNEAFLCMWS